MKGRAKQVQQAQWSYINDMISIKYHKYFLNPLWPLVSGGILKAAGWPVIKFERLSPPQKKALDEIFEV